MAKAIPEGYHRVQVALCVRGAAQAIEFYRQAFGAEEKMRMSGPDGKSIIHAEIKIGDTVLFLSDEIPGTGFTRSPQTAGGPTAGLILYTEDCDAQFQRAVSAGAQATMPPMDMFWGDRWSTVTDPFGCLWSIATHKQDLTTEEIKRGQDAWFKQMAQQQQQQ